MFGALECRTTTRLASSAVFPPHLPIGIFIWPHQASGDTRYIPQRNELIHPKAFEKTGNHGRSPEKESRKKTRKKASQAWTWLSHNQPSFDPCLEVGTAQLDFDGVYSQDKTVSKAKKLAAKQ